MATARQQVFKSAKALGVDVEDNGDSIWLTAPDGFEFNCNDAQFCVVDDLELYRDKSTAWRSLLEDVQHGIRLLEGEE